MIQVRVVRRDPFKNFNADRTFLDLIRRTIQRLLDDISQERNRPLTRTKRVVPNQQIKLLTDSLRADLDLRSIFNLKFDHGDSSDSDSMDWDSTLGPGRRKRQAIHQQIATTSAIRLLRLGVDPRRRCLPLDTQHQNIVRLAKSLRCCGDLRSRSRVPEHRRDSFETEKLSLLRSAPRPRRKSINSSESPGLKRKEHRKIHARGYAFPKRRSPLQAPSRCH